MIEEKIENKIPSNYLKKFHPKIINSEKSFDASEKDNFNQLKLAMRSKYISPRFHSKYELNLKHNPHINIINGDLLQLYKNFRIFSNREVLVSNNPMFNLYAIKDVKLDEVNSFDFGNLVKRNIVPGKLNIIEGGCAFYLYYLKTMIFEDADIKTMYFHYDPSILGTRFRKRAEFMFLEGLLEEFMEIEKLGLSISSDFERQSEASGGTHESNLRRIQIEAHRVQRGQEFLRSTPK